VLESSSFMPKKHLAILLNLFDVGAITLQDIMVPRARIESIKLDDDMDSILHQLATSYHMRLPVFRSALGEVVGVLHLRKVLAALPTRTLDKDALESLLAEPYFVPASTPALTQIQHFQENRERIALVVDEYGELMGLVALEDIIEEIIGKFTTSLPSATPLAWDEDGSATADGGMPVREVNRALGLSLPLEGPRTLNGLILEHLQDIPEADVSIKIANVPMEIVHAQGRTVKTVRIFRPLEQIENAETSAS
jgi:magnesium and cobalt exporter, CNNM family